MRSAAGRDRSDPHQVEPEALEALLRRWAAAGLLTQEQGDAILRAEQRQSVAAPPAPPRLPVATEVVGYLGGILALIGAVLLAGNSWRDLAAWSRLSVLAGVAAVLWAAGALVHERRDPALWRLRGSLWLLSSGAVAFFFGLLALEVADLRRAQAALLAGAGTAVHAGILWRREPRPLQQLACICGLATAAGAGVAVFAGQAAGLGVWVVGVAWVLAGWRRLLPPEAAALALGAVVVLVGAAITAGSWEGAGPALGLATALALLVGASRIHRLALAVVGVAGVAVFLPWTVAQFFARSLGVPVVILLSGLALLGLTLWLLSRARRDGPRAAEPR
jgi:Predicted membrane protein (DUF2157)